MKVLLLNQAFWPDVVSTAQHLTDLAVGLRRAGHEVTVIAGARGYDNPDRVFPLRESWEGIEILRVRTLGLGKAAKWRRALDFGSVFLGCAWRLAWLPRFDVVVALTSPPLISSLGSLFVNWKGGRLVVWAMDINPDEAIAAGWLRANSWTSRVLARMLVSSLRRSTRVVVLDRFMKERVVGKGIAEERIVVIPPWPHDEAVRFDPEGRRAFREAHGLSDKFAVMYSGNHSPCHPLDTLLAAAERLAGLSDIRFCFVGGGSEHARVRAFAAQRGLANVVCLDYQPMDRLAGSLSAADMHVVVMGDAFVGIIHPCKIYNILAVGAPVLSIGPPRSHVQDIFKELRGKLPFGAARHGDAEAVVRLIEEAATSTGKERVETARAAARSAVGDRFSQRALLGKLIAVIEAAGGVLSGGIAGGAAARQVASARSGEAAGGKANARH